MQSEKTYTVRALADKNYIRVLKADNGREALLKAFGFPLDAERSSTFVFAQDVASGTRWDVKDVFDYDGVVRAFLHGALTGSALLEAFPGYRQDVIDDLIDIKIDV